MSEPRISRRQILKTAGAMGVIGALSSSTTALADDHHEEDNEEEEARVRWDIISLSLGAGKVVLSAGGRASAAAEDGSKITLTGSGTFRPGHRKPVTGGGTWSKSAGGSGHYKVTGLVDFDVAPGTAPSSTFADHIGELEDLRSGLAFLQIAYSDGSDGVLVVSCRLPADSPASLFEGITASKGFVDYWNRDAPSGTPGTANANRTAFHVLPKAEDD